MRPTLLDEVAAFLRANGPSTATEIALGIRARREDVDLLLVDGGFPRVPHPHGGSPRATYYGVSQPVPARGGPSQCERVLAVLKDGRPHTMTEIHQFAGFMRLNSRVADLRKRGHKIKCHRKDGDYVYQLLRSVTLDEPAAPLGADVALGPTPGTAGSSSVPETADSRSVESGTLFPLPDEPLRGAYGDEAA